MPKFTVTAIEKFTHRSIYKGVEAPDGATAVQLVKDGEASYDETEILEGGEVYVETEDVEEEK